MPKAVGHLPAQCHAVSATRGSVSSCWDQVGLARGITAGGEALSDESSWQAAVQRGYPREGVFGDTGGRCLLPAPTKHKGLQSRKPVLNLTDREAREVTGHRAGSGCVRRAQEWLEKHLPTTG